MNCFEICHYPQFVLPEYPSFHSPVDDRPPMAASCRTVNIEFDGALCGRSPAYSGEHPQINEDVDDEEPVQNRPKVRSWVWTHMTRDFENNNPKPVKCKLFSTSFALKKGRWLGET